MAIVTIPDQNQVLRDPDMITSHLASIGIEYDRWHPSHPLPPNAATEDILAAYADEIERLKSRGGYVTVDVIDLNPRTPGLEEMLAKFSREHWHNEDEVRFIIHGGGIFHISPRHGPVTAIEVGPGDLIRVPRGTLHWFNLCPDRQIRTIRLFQDPQGWVPCYTESGVERNYEPICLGPASISPQTGPNQP